MQRATPARVLSLVGAVALFVGGCQLVSGLGDLHVVDVPDAAAPLCEAGASQACYSGDPATRGVGACHDGVQTCDAAGDAFEPCMGETLPDVEINCAATIDLDCDGEPPACTGATVWTRSFGGAGDDRGLAIALGKDFSPIFSGSFSGAIDLGQGPLVSVGGTDALVGAVDGTGKATSARGFGGTDDDAASSLAGDDIDNVVLAGSYRGAIDFGDGVTLSNAGDTDAFATRLDASGKAAWTLGLGDGATQEITSVVSDIALDVIAAGTLAGTITTAAGTVATAGSADYDAFAIKIAPTGEPLWIRKFSHTVFGEERALAVAADGTKAAIVVGTGLGDIDFGAGPLPSGGGHDGFVAKIESDGTLAWAHLYGDAADLQAVNAVAVATNNDVLIAGGFDGTLTFEQPLIAEGTAKNVFVARLDSTGKPLWSRRFGDGAADQTAFAVAVDRFDNVYLGGSFNGEIALGAVKLTSAGGGDAFVIKLDPQGVPLWGRRAGDAGFQQVNGILVSRDGVATAIGTYAGTLDFGSPVVSAGGTDIFLARFAP